MKVSKKKIAVVSLVICLVAIVSLNSLAWFTSTDKVDNTLKFVTDFEMDLYETDGAGKIVYNKTGKETIGRTYENITPGEVLYKDPTVINKSSSEAQYIKMTVTVDKASAWMTALGSNVKLADIFTGFDSTKWVRYDEPTSVGDTISYTFYLRSALAAGDKATLFTGVKIPTGITTADATAIGESKITVDAVAIQTTDLGTFTTVKEAFAIVEGN